MTDKPLHNLTWIKVNASVDEGIARLVAVLNQIEGLETVASCEGWPGGNGAYVYFYYGNWESITRLAFENITPAIRDIEGVEISVKVFNGSNPMGMLEIRAEAVCAVTDALISSIIPRKTQYSDDKECTGPHSC